MNRKNRWNSWIDDFGLVHRRQSQPQGSTLLRMRCYWVRQWASAVNYSALVRADEDAPPTCLWCALWC